MSGVESAKPYNIAKRTVWEAYRQVKANRGAAGIDDETIVEFEQNLSKNLYKLWNRMSSGSYFPPPVKQVEIPKASGGTRYHFGMKAHVGADADSGLVHSLHTTAANESDIAHTHHLLHGEESQVHLDAGYTGVERRDEIKQAQGQGTIRADISWHVAAKRSKVEKMPAGRWKDLTKAVERKKAQIRARVEHPFHVVKNLFGHKKTRYKGLAKNTAQMFSLFGLANLVIAKKPLLAFQGSNPS
ncbi:IS5 family transposase [Cupriavidus necator]|uniref:IS5 family transposase n=1 Tax=Cupriavidus necator TaxID=106590 RepID=UPI000A569800|nr:IS5 family transposase [Cupriavidus necator]